MPELSKDNYFVVNRNRTMGIMDVLTNPEDWKAVCDNMNENIRKRFVAKVRQRGACTKFKMRYYGITENTKRKLI